MIPLYQLVKEKVFNEFEIMDRETIRWIETSSSHLFPTYNNPPIKLSAKEFSKIIDFIAKDEWFLTNKIISSLHGKRHSIRVVINTFLLCKLLKCNPVIFNSMLISACIHDLRRLNDKKDLDHGRRSAIWYKHNDINSFFHYPHDDDLIFSTVYLHDISPEIISNRRDCDKYLSSINILKSADALDRFIQPSDKWWPKEELFAIPEAIQLLPHSRLLTLRSENLALNGVDTVKAVLLAAKEIYG